MFTKENLKQFLALQLEAEKVALSLYETYLSLLKEFGNDISFFAEPSEMSFHSVNSYGVTLSANYDDEVQKEFSWEYIQNPDNYYIKARTFLANEKAKNEAKKAANYEREKQDAIQEIQKLREKFGL